MFFSLVFMHFPFSLVRCAATEFRVVLVEILSFLCRYLFLPRYNRTVYESKRSKSHHKNKTSDGTNKNGKVGTMATGERVRV